MTGSPWWRALPAAETWVPCGDGVHPVRWADGTLSLPAHPDAEGEAVLAALGGDRAHCLEVAEAWHRHTSDLDWFMVGPRDPGDEIEVSWDHVQEFSSGQAGSWVGRMLPGGPIGGRPMMRGAGAPPRARPLGGGGWVSPGGPAGPAGPDDQERLRARQREVLTLLALGPALQLALSGEIAASWAADGPRAADLPGHWPALEAALAGRLAPAAEAWLGVNPDLVDARLAELGPPAGRPAASRPAAGWGELQVTGSRDGLRLHAVLPVSWLASVWAPGLAVVGRRLVVAVKEAAWPDATVLAVPAPGRDPVRLSVHATGDDPPHWEITEGGEAVES
ncbi:MAG TPA: hypothetical protein VHW06_08465 [Streptosporangiaceae bacterium]|nr:hypothetical protein [Streptosporangiaceae bacterium]